MIPLSANTANDIISPEYNYYFAPNTTYAPFQIGSYQLSLGNLYAWIPIIIILILLMASKSALGQSGGIFELFGFSTLANMASGIGSGAGTKGIKRAYRAKQSPQNPIFDRYDDYKKAQSLYSGAGGKSLVSEKMALNKQTGKMEKIYTTSVLTFAAWVKAGMPGPATERGNQFPSNLDQVNRYNGKNLSIDRSNFYTFLGLSKVPPDRETAQRAAASQQRMLNMTNPNDPNLDAKKNALKLAQQVAEQNLKPAAAGGGLIAMSTAKQYSADSQEVSQGLREGGVGNELRHNKPGRPQPVRHHPGRRRVDQRGTAERLQGKHERPEIKAGIEIIRRLQGSLPEKNRRHQDEDVHREGQEKARCAQRRPRRSQGR